MQFAYHPLAGENELIIEGEQYIHLYKSRRTKQHKILHFRNLKDCYLYAYKQASIGKKSATLLLQESIDLPKLSLAQTQIILSAIDSKSLQKVLPFLNELGVKTLTLFYADFSQQNEKIDLEKIQKILIHSCQQCGRSNLMEVEIFANLLEVLRVYPHIGVFDFGGNALDLASNFKSSLPILIGPEGGFSPKERELLQKFPKFSTQEDLILRSESACVYVASLMQRICLG